MVKTLFEELATANEEMLKKCLMEGKRPSLEDIAGFEFDGISWDLQKFNKEILIKLGLNKLPPFNMVKFRKGFVTLEKYNPKERIGGYNVQIQPSGLTDSWIYKLQRNGKPKRWRFFEAYPASENPLCNLHPHALLFDYGINKNIPVVEENVRDYVVEVGPGILLGVMFHVFEKNHMFKNYFVLRQAEDIHPKIQDEMRRKFD